MRAGILAVLACGLLLSAAACAGERSEIHVDDLRAYVNTLSDDAYRGRESGTTYARQAAAFIARRYQRAGLAPAFPNASRAGQSYFQEFGFQGGIEIESGSYLRPAKGAGDDFQAPGKVIPLPLGYAGEAGGELIFLGFCLEAKGWNDFAGIPAADLEGKIALCLRHGPGGDKDPRFRREISFRAKYENLVKRKLAGVVFMGRKGFPAPSPTDLGAAGSRTTPAVFVEAEDIFRSYDFLQDLETRMRDTEARSPGASGGIGRVLAKVEMATRFRERELKGYNVGAYLRPPQPEERVIIVGAHFDHIGNGAFSSLRGKGQIHNGADDNASGTAAVLELALQLRAQDQLAGTQGGSVPESSSTSEAAKSDSLVGGTLARVPEGVNVLFLHFDAEERGLFGARHFTKSKTLPANRAAAMLNLDMVGRLRASKGLSVQGEQTADPRWGAIIREAFAETDFADDIELRLVKGGGGPSDHSAFYTERIPVAFLFTGGHREYHTSEDDAHLLNFAGLKNVTEMTGRIVLGLAQLEAAAVSDSSARPLAYRRAPAEAARTDFEFRVRLGIMPGDYSRDAGGLEVSDVRDDAPVKRAGLRAGDVIVKIGGREIRDISDYMEFLGDASAQKEYAIEFKRGDRVIRARTRLMAAP
ncbi:MAG: M28 family peptidase [bacterium]|nr:M28 family peptidase [bacterium]